jgi:hypothetical protein
MRAGVNRAHRTDLDEPTQRGPSSADTSPESKQTLSSAQPGHRTGDLRVPRALRTPEPAAGSVIDLRSFTPARGLPARFPITIGIVTIDGGGASVR